MIIAIVAASIIWFVAAAILFFNPPVDKVYSVEESHPAVRALPKSGKTVGMILLAVVIQNILWAWVYTVISPLLGSDSLGKGLMFGLIIILMKVIPRDIDRMLLTTYPQKRMTIEFVIGIICALLVGITFGYLL
jgi:hypothetical protein